MSKREFVKTKIICTIGPSSNASPRLTAMIRAGMDVVRLNFSHGTYREHLSNLRTLRKTASSLGKSITVIQDLQGPKIRVGALSVPFIELKRGKIVKITTRKIKGNPEIISITYKQFLKDINVGDRVLFDDGKIESKVVAIQRNEAQLRILYGGRLIAHKGINLPGIKISVKSLTEKDKKDLKFAFGNGIDYVALSFVRSAQDIRTLRNFILKNGPKKRTIQIIAKIEKPEAIKDINAIIKESDAIMVARGDLGVELSAEDVPVLQKKIIRKCNKVGKPVIIATQMLESMISNPRPTRAETSDVANAVFDGTDAVMLSGETAVGKYPIEAVKVMDKVIKDAEKHIMNYRDYNPDDFPSTHYYDFLSQSACILANKINASAIVAVTNSGMTAIRLAKYRPSAPILAVTDDENVLRRINLVWGIRSVVIKKLNTDTDTMLAKIEKLIIQLGYVRRNDTIVMLAGIPLFRRHSTNMIKVETL